MFFTVHYDNIDFEGEVWGFCWQLSEKKFDQFSDKWYINTPIKLRIGQTSVENDVIRSIAIIHLQHTVAVECQQSFSLKIRTLNNHEQYSYISCSSKTFSVTVDLFTMEFSILTLSSAIQYIILETPSLIFSGSSLRRGTLNFENCCPKMKSIQFQLLISSQVLAKFRSCFPDAWPNLLHLFLLHVVTEGYCFIIPVNWVVLFFLYALFHTLFLHLSTADDH